MTGKRRARATTTTATGLSNRDRAAMTLAIEQMRNEPSLAGKAVRQLLRTSGFAEAGDYAAFWCQVRALGLRPWQTPPRFMTMTMRLAAKKFRNT